MYYKLHFSLLQFHTLESLNGWISLCVCVYYFHFTPNFPKGGLKNPQKTQTN